MYWSAALPLWGFPLSLNPFFVGFYFAFFLSSPLKLFSKVVSKADDFFSFLLGDRGGLAGFMDCLGVCPSHKVTRSLRLSVCAHTFSPLLALFLILVIRANLNPRQ